MTVDQLRVVGDERSGNVVFGSGWTLVFPDDRFDGEACQQYLKQATTPKREK